MIKTTAIIGMGALGLLYADVIVKTMGNEAVSFIMNEERVNRNKGKVFHCNGVEKQFQITDCNQAKPVDFLIVAVKYNGLQQALEDMKNCIDEHTIIMSVMNGIDSEDIIAGRYGKKHLVYTVAQGMDAMKFDDTLTYTKMGELRVGVIEESQQDNLKKVQEFFDFISMPYTVESDILYRIWGKFMLNVGVNQTCMAFETNYGGVLVEGSQENEVYTGAMREVIALANKKGISLSDKDLQEYIALTRTLNPQGMPSMRQDGVSKRLSEVEMFAGTVRRLSKEEGLATPVNDYLYERIKKMEAAY